MDHDTLHEKIFTNKDILLNILIHLNEEDLTFLLPHINFKIDVNFWIYKFNHYGLPFSIKFKYYTGTNSINKYFNAFNSLINTSDEMLFFGSVRGLLDVVKYLIIHGVNVHVNDEKALFLAVLYKHLDVVVYLHENGAVINQKVLKISVKKGDNDIINYLNEHKNDK